MGRTAGHHRVFNRTKKALQRWMHGRLAQRHAGPMLTPEEFDAASVRRCLVVLPNRRMGNQLLATPLAQWLREGLMARGAREVTVDLCSGGDFAAILAHHPHIRRHVPIPSAAHPGERRALMRQLAAEGYDLAYLANYSRDVLGAKIVAATGARFRVGAGEPNEGPLNLVVKRPDKDDEITLQHRTVLERLGLSPDPSVDLQIVSTPEELADARAIIAGWNLGERRPLGLFVVGHRIKQMPLGHWAQIIERLRRDFPQLEPVVFHGPGDERKVRRLQSHLRTPVRVIAEPLRRFCALVECLEAVVACDGGPLHVARAKRRPLVSLFTKDNWDKFAPRGPRRACLYRPQPGPTPDEVSTALISVLGF